MKRDVVYPERKQVQRKEPGEAMSPVVESVWRKDTLQRASQLTFLSRREVIGLIGTAGTAALFGTLSPNRSLAADVTCVQAIPAETEGPYWVDEMLNRSDIRT